jgi:hypothetical protein
MYYTFYDEHEELLNLLDNFDGNLDLIDHKSNTKSNTKEEKGKEHKKNPIVGHGRSGSVIVKVIHKQGKHEVAVKEISKKGKTVH